jgi:hypothetical protein
MIVPRVPVMPGPAVTGLVTGGQIWAQLPLHLDAVPVSGANMYKVKPWVLVSTVAPSIVVVFSALADEAEPEAALGSALAGSLELEDELPHAARPRAAAITAAKASQTVRHGWLVRPEAARLCPHCAVSRRGPDPGMYCCLIGVLLLVFGSPATGQTPLPVDVHVDPGLRRRSPAI